MSRASLSRTLGFSAAAAVCLGLLLAVAGSRFAFIVTATGQPESSIWELRLETKLPQGGDAAADASVPPEGPTDRAKRDEDLVELLTAEPTLSGQWAQLANLWAIEGKDPQMVQAALRMSAVVGHTIRARFQRVLVGLEHWDALDEASRAQTIDDLITVRPALNDGELAKLAGLVEESEGIQSEILARVGSVPWIGEVFPDPLHSGESPGQATTTAQDIRGEATTGIEDASATTATDDGAAATVTARESSDIPPPADSSWKVAEWTSKYRFTPLDLNGRELDFDANFESISEIVDDRSSFGVWFTPGHPDSKRQRWMSVAKNPEIYEIRDGVLTIHLMKKGAKDWRTGNIQTVNVHGVGNTRTLGYWEAKMAFNNAIGWPAFWLYSNYRYTDPLKTQIEIDVVEAYGDNLTSRKQHHATIHRIPGRTSSGDRLPRQHKGDISTLRASRWTKETNLFDGAYHLFGCDIREDWTIIYLDRIELTRFPTIAEAKVPLYALVSMSMEHGFEEKAGNTFLKVDYVRHWGLRKAR